MPDPTQPLLSILSDQPADEDQLNFEPYAKTLAEIVSDPDADTPLTVGVFGGWGQGKTSLMRMVQRRLKPKGNFPVQTVWFNAWLYSQQPALWRALISSVLNGARGFNTLDSQAREDLDLLEARLYGASAPAAGHLILPEDAPPGLKGAALPPLMGLELLRRQADRAGQQAESVRLQELIADVRESESRARRDEITALDAFRRKFEAISRNYIAEHGRLVVFVDDLDRCLPDKAVEILEAVKLFLDVPGCVFVLGVARDVIEEGIRARYSDYRTKLDGAQYLEKIIQIPFSLPPIAPEDIKKYVKKATRSKLPDPRCETVFTVGLEPNPRRIKRTLNIFLLLWRLAQNREDLRNVIKAVRLAKIVIIQQYHPRLFHLIADGPHYLIDLEERFRAQEKRDAKSEIREGAPVREGEPEDTPLTEQEDVSAGPLSDFLNRSLLRALLACTAPDEADANFSDIGPAGVREYIYLTRSAVEETPQTGESALPFEPQMVKIPAGAFLMGTPEREIAEITKLGGKREWHEREVPQHEVELNAYAISRYPITNAEYARFIEDGGYQIKDYWTETGWEQKEGKNWKQPRYWDDEEWNAPSQPVVGVSWYEAVAYCNWLAVKSGKAYRLPTEAEWEKAARGPNLPSLVGGGGVGGGGRYPWGNEWNPALCNNKESGPGKTTPVGNYPQGKSPYGVEDLAGQVWEWCGSKYAKYPYKPDDGREDLEGDDTRILRGGSWYSDSPAAICRCGYRLWVAPYYGFDYGGFRCARTLSS